ncbi:MAG TPA: TerC family protein [Polyangia bacterium]|jgi:tellurite resistance protein TerC
MTATGEPLAWVVFGVVVAVMLALDLGVFHRRAHVIRGREALVWSFVWIAVALLFNLGVYLHFGANRGLEFFQAYLIEKALSVDNLFVFLAAFTFFAVPENLQHRVLFWGILGALITRGIFIAVGAALLAAFHWVTYIFGVFLVVTALRLLFGGDDEIRPEKNPLLALFRRFVRTTPDYAGTHFFVRQAGKLHATPLLMVLVVIEATDVVFAVDSIPAVFGVTRDVFIVYTSNIFAVLGLRALTFLVARLVQRLRYLKIGLALVLAFVGAKMLIGDRIHISDVVSLLVVAGLIGLSAVASLLVPPKRSA